MPRKQISSLIGASDRRSAGPGPGPGRSSSAMSSWCGSPKIADVGDREDAGRRRSRPPSTSAPRAGSARTPEPRQRPRRDGGAAVGGDRERHQQEAERGQASCDGDVAGGRSVRRPAAVVDQTAPGSRARPRRRQRQHDAQRRRPAGPSSVRERRSAPSLGPSSVRLAKLASMSPAVSQVSRSTKTRLRFLRRLAVLVVFLVVARDRAQPVHRAEAAGHRDPRLDRGARR